MLNWAIDGFWGYSVSEAVLYLLVVTHITIVSVTVYLHRFSAHRSILLGPVIAHFFRFWLWLTTGQVTREWTAVHRKHHAECESLDDPHSPVKQGLPKILWNGVEVYKSAIADEEILRRYGKGCPDDWLEHHLYCRNSLGITLMLVLDLFFFGVLGITIWAIQMVWIPFFAAGIINGVGHSIGYRNFESPDASRNILPWGILIGGEELHNNHHTYPNSAKLSRKNYEFDIGWLWIKLLTSFRVHSFSVIETRDIWCLQYINQSRFDDTGNKTIDEATELVSYSSDPVAAHTKCRTNRLEHTLSATVLVHFITERAGNRP